MAVNCLRNIARLTVHLLMISSCRLVSALPWSFGTDGRRRFLMSDFAEPSTTPQGQEDGAVRRLNRGWQITTAPDAMTTNVYISMGTELERILAASR